MFSKRFDRRVYLAVAVFMFAAALGLSFGAYILWPSRREAGYAPRQPISFSHKTHAGTLQIECLYCHINAEKGAHATVPSVSICMNCHKEVQPKDNLGNLKPAAATLNDYWITNTPIAWNKVNDLADFAYFDHSRHVNSGVECEECHGPVKTMEVMRREYGMKMSWCVDCHKQDPPAGSRAEGLGWETRAPISCMTCHR